MIKLRGYSQVETVSSGALTGKTMADVIAAQRAEAMLVLLHIWPTREQAEAELANYIEQTTASGNLVFSSGIHSLPDGTYQPWLRIVYGAAAREAELTDYVSRMGMTDIMRNWEEEEVPEEKASIWPWALVGGGALVLLIIAGVATSKSK